MKNVKNRIFWGVRSFLIIAAIISLVCFGIFKQTFYTALFQTLSLSLAAFELVCCVLSKNKNASIIIGIILLGNLFLVIGSLFIVKSVTAFYILLTIALLIFSSTLFMGRDEKVALFDLFYVLAIAVPVIIFVNCSHLFGFENVLNRLLVNFFAFTASAMLGCSISRLVRNNSVYNLLFLLVSLINLICCFGLILLKQSNIAQKLKLVIFFAFYAMMLVFSLLTLLKKSKIKNENNLKRNITNTINLFLVSSIICFTIASNFLSFNLVGAKVFKNEFLSKVKNNLNIPIVEVFTQGNEQPQSKEDYVNCSFKISNCDNDEYNFSVPMAKNYEDDGCVGIRLRGNTTMKAKKQPYRIKFDEKQSLFGLKANKSWVLLADYYDQSYMRNFTAFTLANQFDNLDFSPTPHHVALILNNEFKGLYLLCEQMDEKKGRANVDEDFDVSVDKDFPFLVEMDINAWREGETGVDNFYVPSLGEHVEIKYPEADERYATKDSDVVYDYIYEYINAVGKIIKTNQKVEVSFRDGLVGLEDLVDIDSAVDYYLVNEIMLNADSTYKSIYLHKTKDGKMKFGPVWDFDYSMTTEFNLPYEKSYIEEADNLFVARASYIFKYLIQNEDFYNKVSARYNIMSSSILETCEIIKNYKEKIDNVALIDSKMWHGLTGEFQFDMQYDYVRLFLLDRYDYLNFAFSKTHQEFLALL